MKQYLVIAELENTGYIIGTTSDPKEAQDKSAELFILADQIPFNELYKFNDHLSEFQSYPINGNAMYFGNEKCCTSNGSLSVYILEIQTNSDRVIYAPAEKKRTKKLLVPTDTL